MRSSAQAQGNDIRVRGIAASKSKLMMPMPDGRTITLPLAWYSRPAVGAPKQWAHWELAGAGYVIHWPELNEDLSTEGLLAGARAPRDSASWRSPSLGNNSV
jgi:hypothetical protein